MDRAYVDEWWGQEPPTEEEFKVYGISFVPIERRRDETLYHFEGPDVGFERAMEDGYFMSVQYGEDEGHDGFEIYESLDEAKSKAPTDLEIELESLRADYDDFGPDGLYAVPFRTFERNYPEFTKSVIKTFLKEMGILTKEELNDPTTYIDYWQTGELITDQDWPCLFEGAVKLSNGEGVQWEKLYKKYYKPVDDYKSDDEIELPEDELLTEAEDAIAPAGKEAAQELHDTKDYTQFVTELSDILNNGDEKAKAFKDILLNHYTEKDTGLGTFKRCKVNKNASIAAVNLIPTQNNIDMKKSLGGPDGWGPLVTKDLAANFAQNKQPPKFGYIITMGGKYIIDGHHRWSKAYVINPNFNMVCYDFDAPGLSVDDALKGIQLAIAKSQGKIEPSGVDKPNLLDNPQKEINSWVINVLTETEQGKETLPTFPKGFQTPEAVSTLIRKNTAKMAAAGNGDVPNPPGRKVMPQTDKAKGEVEEIIDEVGIIDVSESLTEAAESVEVNGEVTPEQIEEFIEESAHASDRISGSVITFKANNREVTLTSKFGGGMVVVECDEPHISKWLTDYNINMLAEVVNMLLAGRMPRFKGDRSSSPWGGTDSGQQNLSRWR